jgi:predicted extracellular nuclease
MADTSALYTSFKTGLMKATFSLNGTDVVKIALVTGYTFSAAHTKWSDVSSTEVTGDGYSTPGATITTSVATSSTTAQFKITGNSQTWSSSTITASGAIIYKYVSGDATNSPLIAWIDFQGSKSSSTGDFTIDWTSASGVIVSLS